MWSCSPFYSLYYLLAVILGVYLGLMLYRILYDIRHREISSWVQFWDYLKAGGPITSYVQAYQASQAIVVVTEDSKELVNTPSIVGLENPNYYGKSFTLI